jgi:thiol-disulfide isomerase/thioredoxin
MLTFIALSFVMYSEPVSIETDREVFDAMVHRDRWHNARMLVQDHERSYNQKWIEFQWRWNLELIDCSLEGSVELSKQRTKKLLESKAKLAEDPQNLDFLIDSIGGNGLTLPLEVLDPDQNQEFELAVEIRNGREVIHIESVTVQGDDVVFNFGHYGSRIEASLDRSNNFGGRLRGEWIKERGNGSVARVPFESWIPMYGGGPWCPVNGKPLSDEVSDQIEGPWSVDFEESGPAIGEFELISFPDEMEHSRILGTFMTPTGDFRYLGGWVREREGRDQLPYIQMSVFDGAHAFLFTAMLQDDRSLSGDFYSGNWHHETWTAVRDDNASLPDAFEQTVITDEQALEEAVFKDLDGAPTRVLDLLDQSNAKARVIEIFGSWCPNCSDAGRELVSLKEKYGDDLGIVGLAFELTEDFDRSVEQVKRHHAHIGSDWPILIAGLNDKEQATKALGFLDQVRSYPTLVFLNKDNEVQAVYSGFSGPATGDAYTQQRARFEELIERMIAE